MNRTLRAALLLFLAVPILTGCWETGNGEKIGTITRLNKRGVFCQTWEGEIIRGGLNTGSGVMGAAFHFTIEDEKLVPLVKHFMETTQEVEIGFRSEAVTFCRSDSRNYFLKSIRPLNQVATPPAQSKDIYPPTPQGGTPHGNPTLEQLLRQNNELLQRLLQQR